MDGWILQSTAPDKVHETMNEGPARSSTCEPAPHACLLHGPTRKVSSGFRVFIFFIFFVCYDLPPSLPLAHHLPKQ